MSLVDSMMEPFILMDKTRNSDGEGGFTTVWTEGAEIKIALVNDTSMSARIGERQGVTSTYTATFSKDLDLEYHDVIKSVASGRTFRITSKSIDKQSPAISTLNLAQATAEEWSITQ